MKCFKKIFAVMAALAIVLSLASCKGGDTTTTTGSEIENAPTVAPVEVPDPDRGENKLKIAAAHYDYSFLKLSLDRSYAYDVTCKEMTSASAADMLIKNQVGIASLTLDDVAKVASQIDVKILAVTSELKLSMIVKGEGVSDIKALAGKTVYCGGKDTYIQTVTEEIFSDSGVKAELVFLSDKEVAEKIKNGEAEFCVLREPVGVLAISANEEYIRTFELTAYWKEDFRPVNTCIVARTDHVQANPEAVKEFMTHIETCSNSLLTEAGLIYTVTEFIEKGLFTGSDLTMSAVSSSGISYVEKKEMKDLMQANYGFAAKSNPAIAVPADSVYYIG